MNQTLSKTLCAGVTAIALVGTAMADDRFTFGGYFRSGVGANSEGGDQVCFQVPGASAKFRLGNECESYTELDFYTNWYGGDRSDENAPRFDARFTLAAVPAGETDVEETSPAYRNIYAKGHNLVGGAFEGTSFWAGKRFYRRHDVHMNDFYYWDTSGVGGGFEDFNLGFGKLHFAYFRNTNDDFDNFEITDNNGTTRNINGDRINVNDLTVERYDFRIGDIELGTDSKLTLGFDYRDLDENRSSIVGAEDGFGLHLQHFQANVFGGFNKIAIQYGEGLSAGSSLGKGSSNSGEVDNGVEKILTDDDDSTFRIVEQLVWQPGNGSNWGGQFTFVYEDQDYEAGYDQEWIAIGVRPVYWFTNTVSAALELGYNEVKPSNGPDRDLFQATLALQLGRSKGYWERPLIRAFVGYYDWNDAVSGEVSTINVVNTGPSPFDLDDTDSYVYGLQAEAWW